MDNFFWKKIRKYTKYILDIILLTIVNLRFKNIQKKRLINYYKKINLCNERDFVAFVEIGSHPVNYNYLEFLLYIQLISSHKNLFIVFLPAERNEEKFQYKKDNFINDANALRFETILKNLIEVIENFKPNIILLRHRIDALNFFSLSSNSKFPPNASYEKINWKKLKVKDFYYKINNYQNRPLVKSPKYASQLVQNIFLKNIKQIITISIRQNFQINKSPIQNSYRNSNLDVWLNVANWIRDNTNFVPIIIPDIEMLNFNSEYFLDHLVFREATLDLKLRVAIYEEAFLNLSIPSGFTELLFNSLNNYLVFKFGDSRIEEMTPNSYSLILDIYGLVKDDQLPFANLKQKIYWGENSENFEFIKNRLLEYIEKYKE